MIAPVKQLRKADLEWLGTHHCKAHSHTYLEHYQCWLKEQPQDCPFVERVGFLDIEATNLAASFGYVFSYAIKERGGPIIGRVLTPREIRTYKFDQNLMAEMCRNLRKFHRIIVYYGTDYKFDIPYLRTRALKYRLDFPLYKEVYAQDAYAVVKAKLRLHRNRLETACQMFDINAKEHRLEPEIWCKALAGHKPSLEYIWEHNKEDVVSLEQLWDLLEPYTLKNKRSI